MGTYVWPNGARYHGEWRDGTMHGVGSLQAQNGASYEVAPRSTVAPELHEISLSLSLSLSLNQLYRLQLQPCCIRLLGRVCRGIDLGGIPRPLKRNFDSLIGVLSWLGR